MQILKSSGPKVHMYINFLVFTRSVKKVYNEQYYSPSKTLGTRAPNTATMLGYVRVGPTCKVTSSTWHSAIGLLSIQGLFRKAHVFFSPPPQTSIVPSGPIPMSPETSWN